MSTITTGTRFAGLTPKQHKELEDAAKGAAKAVAACPPGGTRSGRLKLSVEYTVSRGEAYTKSVPMAACPWTLLALALQRAGFGREALRGMVDDVLAMDDEGREALREGVGESTKAIMAEIGRKTEQVVQGNQTFSHLVVEVE